MITVVLQGEEGPPSLEYIQAKDLFPQKELVKEDDSLQVSCFLFSFFLSHDAPKLKFLAPKFRILWNNKKKKTEPKNPDRHRVCASRNFVFASLYSSY